MARNQRKADPYPAPEGNFKPTIKTVLKDHVLIGQGIVIGCAFFVPYPFNLVIAMVGVGTIVDTWVHRFFH